MQSKPPDRVKYTNLSVLRKDFEDIEKLARELNVLKKPLTFDDYADTSFVPNDEAVKAYAWEGKRP